MKYLFIILALLIYLLANYYVFSRTWEAMPLNNNLAKNLLIAFAVLVIASLFLALFVGEYLPVPVTSVFYVIGTSWIIIFVYFLIANLFIDLVKVTRLVPKETISLYAKDNWISFGLIVGFIFLLMLCGYLKYRIKERVELAVQIEKNADDSTKSLKIVAFSDMHLGYNIGKKELGKWVDVINKEKPDLILIAGDIIDNSVRPLEKYAMSEELKKIKSKYGIYAVLGNHEYLAGVDKSIKFIKQSGIHLLRDSSVLVDDVFYIVGRDDESNPNRKDLTQLMNGLDKNKPVILLDHQPHNLNDSEKNGIDFQFSGHTHRGQIWPISLITDMIYEDSYGFLKKGSTNIYVSSGIGIWGGKFRIGTQSEYVVVNLTTK